MPRAASGPATSGHAPQHLAGHADPDRLMQIADGRSGDRRRAGNGGAHAERCDQGEGGDGGDHEFAHGTVPSVRAAWGPLDVTVTSGCLMTPIRANRGDSTMRKLMISAVAAFALIATL